MIMLLLSWKVIFSFILFSKPVTLQTMKEGSNIASYVAATKEPVRVANITVHVNISLFSRRIYASKLFVNPIRVPLQYLSILTAHVPLTRRKVEASRPRIKVKNKQNLLCSQ